MTEQLTFSWGGPPASPTASPVSGGASRTRGGTSPSSLSAWLTEQAQDGCSGKMCRASFQAGAEAILPASYRCSADGRSPSPRGDGAGAGPSSTPPDASGWLGEYWTHNIPEFPASPAPSRNGDGACSSSDTVAGLSEILWTGPIPQRYFLTEKCAKGILRRAERRHRELPPLLLAALRRQAGEA